MSKKITALLLTSMLFVCTAFLPVFGEYTDNVIDNDGIIGGDIDALQDRIDDVYYDYDLDVVIVATDDVGGKTSRDFADDYYDYNDYGVGDDKSGLLLLIDLDNRNLWISTTGDAIDIFTDARIDSMLDDIVPYAGDGNYYGACESFIDNVNQYAKLGVPDGQYRQDEYGNITYYKPTYLQRLKAQSTNPITYILPVVIGLIAVMIASFNQKGKVTVTGTTYEGKNSFKLRRQHDIFMRKAVTTARRPKPSSSSSGGGSSTHTSSSGTSHGGGGRSF